MPSRRITCARPGGPDRPVFGPVHAALTTGIGLLPCPLTISVLGFVWAQSPAVMVGLVLLSLALGISLTSHSRPQHRGHSPHARLPQLERRVRILQAAAAVCIIALGTYAMAALVR
jgi:hypothetical protein